MTTSVPGPERLRADLPEMDVVVAADDAEVRAALPRADASYGWVAPQNLALATRLRWLQNPFAGPFPGYYYDALIEHPVVITNPRGIYSDHIAHHILDVHAGAVAGVALLDGGGGPLPYWMEAQRLCEAAWTRVGAPPSPPERLASGGFRTPTSRARFHGARQRRRWRAARIAAGLDVFEIEPLPDDHPLCVLIAALGAKVIGVDPRPEHDCPATIQCRRSGSTSIWLGLWRSVLAISSSPPCPTRLQARAPETEFMWNRSRALSG